MLSYSPNKGISVRAYLIHSLCETVSWNV